MTYLGDLSCVIMCNGCLVMSSILLPTLLAYYFLFSFEIDYMPVLLSCLGLGLGLGSGLGLGLGLGLS